MAQLWAKWQVDDAEISAPSLWQYEVTSVLHRLLHSGQLTTEEAQQLLETAMAFEVQSVEVDEALCAKAFEWATRLQTAPAYDSFYLALAERLQAEFWTGDRRLANNAQSHGAAWVRWIGKS
jgi:predicted nucleic acid-binding protein